jgi:hypothetical protein
MINNKNLINCIYSVYGLKIKSDISMPELLSIIEEQPIQIDALISCGVVPKEIEDVIVSNEFYKLSKNEFYMYIKGVAHYYVTKGSRIIIEPEDESDIENIKLFLLGTCFGILLAQRNTVAIHGGTVVVDGKGIIVTGHTGAGKSTLVSAFRNEGHAFLADDVSALGIDIDNNIIIHPTYPQQKLCKDAMDKMGYDTDNFLQIDSYRDKYAIPLETNFADFPVLLKAIYEVNIGQGDKIEFEEILGFEKMRLILRNIYRIEVSKDMGLEAEYFKQCVKIAKTVPVYRIKRPKDSFTVKEQMNLIKNSLKVKEKVTI